MALLVQRGIVTGQKAERFKMEDLQLTLQMLEMLLDPESGQHEPEPAGEPQKVREHERRPHGRAPLPEHLPRVQSELLPPEVQHDGLDVFVRVGEAVREVLAPARVDGRGPHRVAIEESASRRQFRRKVRDPP